MKKNLLLVLCFISLLTVRVSASHLMGGQITVAQVSGLDYQVTMQLYRDVTGIPISPTATIYVEDVVTTTSTTYIFSYTGPFPHLNGVEMYEYSGAITLPYAGQFRIYWEECCRNAAILNMSAPGSESLHLMTILTADGTTPNSTPVFLNPPATLAQKNSLWQYNPLPFDADGDSLAWLMETPLGATGVIVAGFTAPHADPLNPFTLNAQTGEITWMPDSNGHWEASFRVEEYRAGVKIGEIRRDMQIIVVDDTTNYHPVVINNGSWPVNSQGNFAMNIAPGTSFNLTIVATDQDMDQLSISAQGEPMALANNPAQWSVINSGAGSASGTFSWTPVLSQQRSQPYIMAFRTTQQHNQNIFTTDETVLFHVTQNTGIENSEADSYERNLYPNPSKGEWNLSFKLANSSEVKIDVTDVIGKKVATITEALLPSGVNMIRNTNSNLIAGYYFVNVTVNGKKAFSMPLTIE